MKMKQLMLILIIFVLFIFSCDNNNSDFWPDESGGNFWAQNTVTYKNYRVDAELLGEGEYCEVWVEKGSGVNSETARQVAVVFDEEIYQKMIDVFGSVNIKNTGLNTLEAADYLGNYDGKLCILLLDIKDDYMEEINDAYVAGYFWYNDFYENGPGFRYRYSNERDMIYIDINPGDIDSEGFYATIAHETQHLMNFVSSYYYRAEKKSIYLMDLWINEGLSSAAEWLYTEKHSKTRYDWFNKDESKLIGKGNNFFVWGNREKEYPNAVLDDYATVYLFFQWLRLQSNLGEEIYGDIISSPYPAYDYHAVTNAAGRFGIINVNDDWGVLLKTWLAANYIKSSSGLYGYKDDEMLNSVITGTVPAGINKLPLAPGEGVYSIINESYPRPNVAADSPNIRYAGLTVTPPSVNDSSTFPSGVLLTYNINTNEKGKTESAMTTGIAASVMAFPGRSLEASLSGPFPIGAGDKQNNNEINSIHLPELFSNGFKP